MTQSKPAPTEQPPRDRSQRWRNHYVDLFALLFIVGSCTAVYLAAGEGALVAVTAASVTLYGLAGRRGR